jgi:hypothetical protein
MKEKQDLLFKLKRLKSKGVPLSKVFNEHSPLSELQQEFTTNHRDSRIIFSFYYP